jgi:hypothetical protein
MLCSKGGVRGTLVPWLDIISSCQGQTKTKIHIIQINNPAIFIQQLYIHMLNIHRPKIFSRCRYKVQVVLGQYAEWSGCLNRYPRQYIFIQDGGIERTVKAVAHTVIVVI